jgi:ribosome-associated toxin RatA of RatAB toxin-antitoxin module
VSTRVEHSILVNVPVSVAYNQWTQFEDFPHFMNGITKVSHVSDDRLEWVAELAGVKRKWEARILEQVPDKKVAWAATSGATNAGEVTFEDLGGGQTSVRLSLEYEPEGLVEKIGDKLNVVDNQTEGDLQRFKAFIEAEGYASGAWRGTINEGGVLGTPNVADAESSKGDSGKAGISGKVVAAGLAAAAAVGVAAAVAGKKDDTETVDVTPTTYVEPVVVEPVAVTPTVTDAPLVDDGPLMTDELDPDVDPTLRDIDPTLGGTDPLDVNARTRGGLL